MRAFTLLKTRWNSFVRLNHTLFLKKQSIRRTLFLFVPGFAGCFLFANSVSFQQFKTFCVQLHLSTTAMAESLNKKTKTLNFIADAVEMTAPAVVHIDVPSNHRRFQGVMSSSGSGFIVSEDGMLLTNAHVVRHSNKVSVKLANGETFNGYVVDCDEGADLAAIKLDCKSNVCCPYSVMISLDLALSNEIFVMYFSFLCILKHFRLNFHLLNLDPQQM